MQHKLKVNGLPVVLNPKCIYQRDFSCRHAYSEVGLREEEVYDAVREVYTASPHVS